MNAPTTFLHLAAEIAIPAHLRPQPVAFKTLFTTADSADAYDAGFTDGPTVPGVDGGFAIHFDGRFSVPTVSFELQDGEICGLDAIREARKALERAEKLAERQS